MRLAAANLVHIAGHTQPVPAPSVQQPELSTLHEGAPQLAQWCTIATRSPILRPLPLGRLPLFAALRTHTHRQTLFDGALLCAHSCRPFASHLGPFSLAVTCGPLASKPHQQDLAQISSSSSRGSILPSSISFVGPKLTQLNLGDWATVFHTHKHK